MAWHRPGELPLSEPLMVSLMMQICVTWPQWVNVDSFCYLLNGDKRQYIMAGISLDDLRCLYWQGNWLTPWIFEWNYSYIIFKRILVISGWGISHEIALISHDQSTLVQVMAWRRQATSHYLSQCWPRSLSSYGVTRPQCVKCSFCSVNGNSSVKKNHFRY